MMHSAISLASGSPSPSTFLRFSLKPRPPILSLSTKSLHGSSSSIIKAISKTSPPKNHIIQTLKTTATAAVFILAAASSAAIFHVLPARAEPSVTTATSSPSPITRFLETNSEGLKSLLQQKIASGEDEEAMKILENLISAQPNNTEYKFLKARLLSDMGNNPEARQAFEEILERDPFSFEALFENALLMDRCGEGKAVIDRLEQALEYEGDKKTKEARDVRLIIAQMEFLQKNVEGALSRYDELSKEDPKDYRPYFCRGMIYSLLDRNKEAKEQFAKFRELSPKKFDVEGYLRTPLSKMKLFGTDEGI